MKIHSHLFHRRYLMTLAFCTVTLVADAQTINDVTEPGRLATTTLVSTRTERAALESPGSVVSIRLDDETHDFAEDVGDLVSQTPGVSIPFDYRGMDTLIPYLNGGYKSFNIRGIDGNRVLLEIDGIRQVPEYTDYIGGGAGGTTRAMFDPKVLESVEILKGSASALYGSDALGGVISMRTNSLVDVLESSERPWYLSGGATYYGVNEGINLVGKAGVRSGDFYATVVNSYRESKEQQNDKGEEPYPEETTSNHALVNFAFLPDGAHRFFVTAEQFISDNESNLTGMTYAMSLMGLPYTIDYSKRAVSEAELERSRVSFRYEHVPLNSAPWDKLSAHVYVQNSDSDILTHTVGTVGFAPDSQYPGYRPAPRNRQDIMQFEHEVLGLSLLGQKQWLASQVSHTLIAGFDYSTEDARNSFLRFENTTTPPSVSNRMSTDPSTLNRMDLFVQDEIDLERWLLVAGVRFARYEIEPDNDPDYLEANPTVEPSANYSNNTLTPSFSALYKLTNDSVIWGRYARGIKNPTNENYTGAFSHSGGSDPFIILANPDLDPEKSDAFEVGYRKHGEHYKLELSAHQTYYEDFIDSSILIEDNVAPEPDIYSHDNIEEVEIRGVEIDFLVDLASLNASLDGFSLRLNAAWTEGENKTDDLQLATISPFETVASLSYESKQKWGGTLTATYRAKKSHASELEERGYYVPDSSVVVDAYAYYKPTQHLKLRAGVNNLTDERYWVWSNASRGGHSGTVTERNVQPGINAYVAFDITL